MDIYRIPFITERSNDGTEPTEEERQLRICAQRIRERYKRSTVDKVQRLSKKQTDELSDLGFDWRLPTMIEQQHNYRY